MSEDERRRPDLGPGDLEGRRVVVVGLGQSGRAAVKLLLTLGAEVIGTDQSDLSGEPELVRHWQNSGVRLLLGPEAGALPSDADLVVVSPGVPPRPEWDELARRGVSVISETELSSRYLRVPICAVGGTNGKSTVTTLIGAMMEASGLRYFLGGNLGLAACEAPLLQLDVAVLEVSSFQLERLETFRPKVSILLGVSEDHLDRYGSFQEYVDAKGNAFVRQMPGDVAIVPSGDEVCLRQAERGRGSIVTFGLQGDYLLTDAGVQEAESGAVFDLRGSDLHGRHNWRNAAAAIAAARALGLEPEAISRGIRAFRALPHRMALAGRVGGVSFYDDSKATNVGAAVTALLGLAEDRAVMILGGRDKLGSYDALARALGEKGRAAIVLGEARDRITEALSGVVPVERADSMSQAVARAFAHTEPGDAVLLSPACSSLDMYKNYAERGKRFIEAVLDLKKSQKDVPS